MHLSKDARLIATVLRLHNEASVTRRDATGGEGKELKDSEVDDDRSISTGKLLACVCVYVCVCVCLCVYAIVV